MSEILSFDGKDCSDLRSRPHGALASSHLLSNAGVGLISFDIF